MSTGTDDAQAARVSQAVRTVVATTWSPGFRGRFDRAAGVELGATDTRVLWELLMRGETQPSQLAAVTDIGAPSISKALLRLRERGLVTQEQQADDRRFHTVRLSATGTALATRLYDAGVLMQARILAGWPPEDRARFAALIERYAADLATYDIALGAHDGTASSAG